MSSWLEEYQKRFRENWVPHVTDLSAAQTALLWSVFHNGLMLGRESAWAGMDYDEVTALNPYRKEEGHDDLSDQ